MRGEEGFSLIELLVALIIMSMVTSIAILTNTSHNRLAVETDRLIASLKDARDRAVIENQTVTVEISDEGYQARTHTRIASPAADSTQQAWEQGTSAAIADGALPAVLTFDPVGLAEPITLTLYRDGIIERIAIDAAGEIRRAGDDD